MVDIVDIGVAVDKLYEVADDGDDVLLGKDAHVHRCAQVELAVDAVAADFAKVVALLAEEEVLDNLAGACVVWRIGVAELLIDVVDSLGLAVGLVALEGIVI